MIFPVALMLITSHVFAISGNSYSHVPVYVRECEPKSSYITIYKNKDLTIPLPNPFMSDVNGDFTVFMNHHGCVDIKTVEMINGKLRKVEFMIQVEDIKWIER